MKVRLGVASALAVQVETHLGAMGSPSYVITHFVSVGWESKVPR